MNRFCRQLQLRSGVLVAEAVATLAQDVGSDREASDVTPVSEGPLQWKGAFSVCHSLGLYFGVFLFFLFGSLEIPASL